MPPQTEFQAPGPCPAAFNLAAHVLAGAEAHPDSIALRVLGPADHDDWSHARLHDAVRGLGTVLLDIGLAPGDRVLLLLGNTVEFPQAFLGCIAVGLVPVVTSAQWTRAEVEAVIAGLFPSLILAGDGLALPAALPCPLLGKAAIVASITAPACSYAMDDPDRLAYMITTSGTSGRPHAVMHAHRAIRARQMMHRHWIGLTKQDRVLHAGAMNWTCTLGVGLLDPWTAGATALIPAAGVQPAELPDLMRRHDATIFAASPGLYRQMLRTPLPALPRLRHGLSAGEALSSTLRSAWEAATGRPVFEACGLSECSTFVSGAPEQPAPRGTMGYAQPGRKIAVLAPDGTAVAQGAIGGLAIHRSDPGLCLGYFGAADETAACHDGDWFVTGDMVRMAADGALTYLGHDEDMMNAGGYRVSPVGVEDAMRRLAGIRDCAAAEISVKKDATVIACFHTAAAPLDDATLSAHAQTEPARDKQPQLIVPVPELPRGANNKLLRRVLRQRWEDTHASA